MNRLTRNEFIKKASERFPDYDYSLVEYVNNKTKVRVICPKHGIFEIRPDCLLNGTGCPKCGGTKKSTNAEFISKATFVHGSAYSYDRCEYKNSNSKVVVTCPIHGDFEIKANNHLNGQGCPMCYNEGIKHTITRLTKVNSSTKKLDTAKFIEKAKDVHGDRYDYSKSIYEKSCSKVIVTCKEHGDFQITPNHLLSGRGCPKCGKNYRYTTDEFVTELVRKTGRTYLTDRVVYTSTHKPISLGCREHGYFDITPANALRGKGCPICNESHLESEVATELDKRCIEYNRQYTCKELGRLKLDFYIPSLRVAIECQGIQHFKPVGFFGGSETYEKQVDADTRKREICDKIGIKLLYYTHENVVVRGIIRDIESLINSLYN